MPRSDQGLSGPGLDDDDLLQVARVGVLKTLGTFAGDRRNIGHVIGYCCLVSRRHAVRAIRQARAHCRHSNDVVSLEDRQSGGAAREDAIGGADGDLHAIGRAFNEPHDRAEHNELLRLAAQVLGSLPARQAGVVRLVAIEGLTYAQAADRRGVARKTVDVDLWRARQALGRRATGRPHGSPAAPLLRVRRLPRRSSRDAVVCSPGRRRRVAPRPSAGDPRSRRAERRRYRDPKATAGGPQGLPPPLRFEDGLLGPVR